jgi:hypothetical protein
VTNIMRGASLRWQVKQLEGGPYYTTYEVADMLDRSWDTIKRWRDKKKHPNAPQPSTILRIGKLDINLYTEEDIQALRLWSAELKAGWPKGRQRKETPSADSTD